MAIWNKLRSELDRAGRVAQDAIDEGKVRLDAFRARQLADKAAQALGYAVYRARQQGQELDSDSYARLSSTLAAHESEATRLEERLAAMAAARRGTHDHGTPADRSATSDTPSEPAPTRAPDGTNPDNPPAA
ncbi:MAG TPA: hypothetical protein VFS05_12590 [Gemmatimonadaceae bacterium]|nr:hypothetical protein [Gemmatimonadaceae bacterium]